MESTYYHSPESVADYIQMATGINGRELIEQLHTYLPNDAHVLEIGSGPGSDWQLLNEKYQVTGSDFSKEFLKHLHTRYPEGIFIELDAVTLETRENFQSIYSNKVLHHLTDSELQSSIGRQYEILEPEGIICHSFWKGSGTEAYEGMYVNNHMPDEIHKLFSPAFEILKLDAYKEFEPEDSLLLIAKKK